MSANPDIIETWVKKLNGKKVLILGNHDRLKPFTYLDLGFTSVHTSLPMKIGMQSVVCTHDPAPVCGTDHNHRWLVGHVHGLFKDMDMGRVTNVGVDVWEFTPVSEIQLLEYWKELLA
jgi:calcineurin-like phosphoesterase family protein